MLINFTGLITAFFVFVSIGFGFFWVIKLEYHIGASIAPIVGILGFLLIVASAFMPSFWISLLTGVTGGTILWGATELPDQKKRAENGQFPIKDRGPKK